MTRPIALGSVLAVLAVLTMACGGSASSPLAPTPVVSTTVKFRLDANSCGSIFGTRTLTFSLFVDGAQVGTANLGIGVDSPAYPVIAGSHVGSASVTNTTLRWANLNFAVPTGTAFTYVLLC